MRGDHDAFAELAGAAFPKLYGSANLILGQNAAAQEAVQTTLIRAWQDLPRLRDGARSAAEARVDAADVHPASRFSDSLTRGGGPAC